MFSLWEFLIKAVSGLEAHYLFDLLVVVVSFGAVYFILRRRILVEYPESVKVKLPEEWAVETKGIIGSLNKVLSSQDKIISNQGVIIELSENLTGMEEELNNSLSKLAELEGGREKAMRDQANYINGLCNGIDKTLEVVRYAVDRMNGR